MNLLSIQTFFQLASNRSDLLLGALWEHIHMSLIALLISVFIAVPLAVILSYYRKGAEPVIGLTAVLQTIPSLALLGFLIPFIGIGTFPAIVALTAYALMPILRNTYTGIKGIDPSLMEASRGMGMTTFQQLYKVQLPLAMPTIMAGIRTAMVLIVGTATLAALIGAGGLGDLIMLGINRSNNYYILLGAIPAALLALILDAVLRFTEKRSLGTSIAPIAIVVGVAIVIVSSPTVFRALQFNDAQEEIIIAGKMGAEPEIILNMYKILIEQDTDYKVVVEDGFGTTSFTFEALRAGDIDGYFEFTGTAIVNLLNEEPISNEEGPAFEQARDGMYDEFGMVFLEPMDFQNTYAIAVREDFAEDNNLETIGDLRAVQDDVTAGFTFEFMDRADGYPGIQEAYDLDLGNVQGMDPGLRGDAVEADEVQVIDAYSTDSYMIRYSLVSLEDDKNVFPPFNGAPLFREDVLIAYPEIEDILNQLGGLVTEEEMLEMNYQVDEDDRNAEDVAREFLESEGLLQQ
ncbi:ABC transporter permease/substrate-binding protein [Salisediminibacterium beveridgei]|uniref:Glycine betaine/carnitine/choline transport system permease protein opuCB n=1 Tax=Salisediminibacterium beveridgei TaxID=632773 RepID=A0A1D7QVJ5_9BACI|nr:ABC transporter permease/substrate-binding protein [Salisediminibacterium beveridgei]AOM83027.1 Glycine betaine/carnitine/choline transport system permease protein opuCB [Salisediminibacterium beveridgei]